MNISLSPRQFVKLNVTCKNKLDPFEKGEQLVITAQAFAIARPDQNKIQVYSELRYKPFHMSMNCADLEDYFEDISEFIENNR